jgi:hypothetical protein
MNLLQFSGDEIGSNRQLHPMFTISLARHRHDGRRSRRRQGHLLLVEDLEGRQLLSGIVADVQKVREAAVIVADVQKIREAANAIQDARLGTDAATGGQFYFRE